MSDVAAPALKARRPSPVSSFETWPPALFYAPVFVYWFVLAARHRGLTLPTIANVPPALSGYLGESKSAALALLGPKGRAHLPPHTVFAASETGDAAENARRAADAMGAGALSFPLVAKPDIGQNGTGVKIVRDKAQLDAWLASFPRGLNVILQKYIADEGEAGIVYVRYPHEAKGRIASLTLKYLPRVTGDGASTLHTLIMNDPRARHFASLYIARHGARADRVVPEGEQVRLVSVGNHCKGAIFKNGQSHIAPGIETALDEIAREIPGFFFGRFDIRFHSLSDLEEGRNFAILEVNGADSEMTHIWDAEESLWQAWRTLFRQHRIVFEIGAENRRRGARPVTPREFIRAWLRNRALFKSYRCEE